MSQSARFSVLRAELFPHSSMQCASSATMACNRFRKLASFHSLRKCHLWRNVYKLLFVRAAFQSDSGTRVVLIDYDGVDAFVQGLVDLVIQLFYKMYGEVDTRTWSRSRAFNGLMIITTPPSQCCETLKKYGSSHSLFELFDKFLLDLINREGWGFDALWAVRRRKFKSPRCSGSARRRLRSVSRSFGGSRSHGKVTRDNRRVLVIFEC